MRVIDTAPASARGSRARVFQPFQRLGDNPSGAGVGLGLAVAKGFVNAVGGELVIEDTPGGGTTMVITIPIDSSWTPPASHRRRSAVRACDGLQPARDGRRRRRCAFGGWDRRRRRRPRRMSSFDLGLPDMRLEVLNGLRAWTAVAVIVLSHTGPGQAKVAALDGGADTTSPTFSMNELAGAIRAPLRRLPGAVNEEPVVDTNDFPSTWRRRR